MTDSADSQAIVDGYFSLVDHEDHWWFVYLLVTQAFQSESSLINGNFLASALHRGLCSPEALEEGLTAAADNLDIAKRNGYAGYQTMIKILKTIGFDSEEERVVRIASHVKNSEKLIQLTLW